VKQNSAGQMTKHAQMLAGASENPAIDGII